ncbi:MAG: class I SAM-dependent methyltransferase [Pseudomonadota bacterium]
MSNRDETTDDLKTIGRSWADDLQAEARADGTPNAWFEGLYARAGRESGYIPWEHAAPRDVLRTWLGADGEVAHGAAESTSEPDAPTALDVGCGLGDNAAILAAAGYAVTAFDLSPSAAEWAGERFGERDIVFEAADLFSLPTEWQGRFDLVHECYTLQSLTTDRVPAALDALAACVGPGGRLLVIARALMPGMEVSRPPNPIPQHVLDAWTADRAPTFGLERTTFETFEHTRREQVIPHWLGVWQRDAHA